MKPSEESPPFAAWDGTGNRLWILAATRAAEAAGIHPGQSLADAKALFPALATAAVDRQGDDRTLHQLAAWCRRFSPWTSPFGERKNGGGARAGEAGIWLDITGCAHLAGGEESLLDNITAAVVRAGFSVRAGLAGTPGAAYALARFGGYDTGAGTKTIATSGEEKAALAPLPVVGLRLDEATVDGLDGLGLRRIGDLYPLAFGAKRAMLAARFPAMLLKRVDQALGFRSEPISPGQEQPRFITRLTLPEPTRSEAVVARICNRLVIRLTARLNAHGLGGRRFVFSAFGADGRVRQAKVSTARAVAAAAPLLRLFELKIGQIDPGFGVDGFSLEAFDTSPLSLHQERLGGDCGLTPGEKLADESADETLPGLASLVDRLSARFGRRRVGRIMLHPNHLPERAQVLVRAESCCTGKRSDKAGAPPRLQTIPSYGAPPRPLCLLPQPERLETDKKLVNGVPAWFHWRGTHYPVARHEGPERIALDWWTLPGWQANPCAPAQPPGLGAAIRDYYRVESAAGMRFWIYRSGLPHPDAPACWFLHGIFP